MESKQNLTEICQEDILIIDGDRGKNYPQKDDFKKSGYCLFLSTSNIKSDQFSLKTASFISREKDEILRKGKLKRKDIILTTRGTVGSVAFFHELIPYSNIRINSGMVIIRNNSNKFSTEFLYQVFKSPFLKEQYRCFASGSAQPQLPIKDLRRIHIPSLPLINQRKIAAILTTFDNLIDTNSNKVFLLEKTTKEIFKEWFIRMRFPGYEKTEMIKGIPRGWHLDTIESFGKIITGKTPSTQITSYYGGDIPFIKTPDMHGNIYVNETSQKLTIEGRNSQMNMTIPKDSLCVNCIGALSGSVSISIKESQTNQQIHSLIPKEASQLEFLYWTLFNLKETIIMFGNTGSTMTNLSKTKFSNLNVLRPTAELIFEYHEMTKSMFDQIRVLGEQNIKLRNTKQLLISRLMSGKLTTDNLNIEFPPSMGEQNG